MSFFEKCLENIDVEISGSENGLIYYCSRKIENKDPKFTTWGGSRSFIIVECVFFLQYLSLKTNPPHRLPESSVLVLLLCKVPVEFMLRL